MIDLSHPPFFIFGCGKREKFVCTTRGLVSYSSGESIVKFIPGNMIVQAPEYTIIAQDTLGNEIRIQEDEEGIWLTRKGKTENLASNPVRLPTFQGHPYQKHLRILHNEILTNIFHGKPLPNFLVYKKPWYRDAAMMAMVMEITGNVDIIRGWILNIRDPFDRNNAGNEEPDNLGQVLYLVSLVSDASHPVVQEVREAAVHITRNGHLNGMTDFAEHPIYQTRWLKFGLCRLGLQDDFILPQVDDSYAPLFWWDRDNRPDFPKKRYHAQGEFYPYLTWAETHFHTDSPPMQYSAGDYPKTWEAQASQADYNGMRIVDDSFAQRQICMPHTWHAAEMFLYLWECR